jgi:hypothetical protein
MRRTAIVLAVLGISVVYAAALHHLEGLYKRAPTIREQVPPVAQPHTIIGFDTLVPQKGWERHEIKPWMTQAASDEADTGLVDPAVSPAARPTYPKIDVTVAGLEQAELGGVATVQFQVKEGMPARAPTDQAATWDETLASGAFTRRSRPGKLGPRWPDSSRLDLIVVSVPNTVRLVGKGFIVVPPGQPMPFGVDLDSDRLRLVFPLYVPEAEPTETVGVGPLQAGSFYLNVSRVSVTATGQLRTRETLFDQTWDLIDHTPVIVVQDRFTAPKPNGIFLAPSGDHELWIYKGRFDVFNATSGGLILSLVGENPGFSPTGRFLTYDNGGKKVVVDVLARRPTHVSNYGPIAFMAGDAYLYANEWYGQFDFLSSFVDGAVPSRETYFQSSRGARLSSIPPISVRLDISGGLLWIDFDSGTIDQVTGSIIPPDPDPGKRPYDIVSLLTGISWLGQVPSDDATANQVRELFSRRADFQVTSDEYDNLSDYVVQLRPLTTGPGLKLASRIRTSFTFDGAYTGCFGPAAGQVE